MNEGTQSIDELIVAQKPGYSLDQRFYTDPDIYALEIDRIVNRNWILAGHESQLRLTKFWRTSEKPSWPRTIVVIP